MSSQWVHDIDEGGFAASVLERSHNVPVVVDFWAPWCGPCRTLGPLIEREIEALGGRVELAKVNSDLCPTLSEQYAIRSIPAVKAFRDGQVVDEFVGALPVPALRAFLAKLLPSPAVANLTAARAALQQRAFASAEPLLRELLADAEHRDEAAFHLAHLALGGVPEISDRPAAIRAAAAKIADDSPLEIRREGLTRLADFLEEAQGTDPAQADAALVAEPKNHDRKRVYAAALFAAGRARDALEQLVDSVARNPKHADAAARKLLLALFDHLEQLGRDPDLAYEFRRRLQIVS